MAANTWQITLNDTDYTVRLEHTYWSGRRRIWVNDAQVVDERKLLDNGSIHEISLGGHPAHVHIRSNSLTFGSDLVVDNVSVTTGKPLHPPGPVPLWGWVFVIACLGIPVVSVGGALPALIGIVGALWCHRVVRDSNRTMGRRAILAAGITTLCWFAALVTFMLVTGIVD